MKLISVGDGTFNERAVRYIHFEFYTPSTHECFVYHDGDEVVGAEEIAYGDWITYREGDVASWLVWYGIDVNEIIAMDEED